MPLITVHHGIRKFWLVLSLSLIAIVKFTIMDQVTKILVRDFLITQPGNVMHITNWFELVYSWNYGISFGIFSEYHQYTNKIFIGINSFIVLYLWRQMFVVNNWGYYVGYSLIIGGAVGNLVDRVLHGAVFDFLYFHYNDYGFAAFNLADSFIFCGVVWILYSYVNVLKAVAKEKEENYDEFAEEAEKIRRLDSEIAKKDIKIGV